MKTPSFSHLRGRALLDTLAEIHSRDTRTTAELLSCMGEVDAQELYLGEACGSMYQYCVQVLSMDEAVAYKRIRVARLARKFPAILDEIGEGRISLSHVMVLSRHLEKAIDSNVAEELVGAAVGRTREELEVYLAQRSPGRRVRDSLEPGELAPGRVDRLAPTAPDSWMLKTPLTQRGRELFQEALELMSHQNPYGRFTPVVETGLELLVAKLRKEKYAETDSPRGAAASSDPRCIPAAVRRAADERDGGACTFVGDNGHVCGSRWQIEYDHIVPIARGGQSTVDNVRQLCRAHNQYAAKQVYGAGFMDEKKRQAQEAREAERARHEEEAKRRVEERAKAETEARIAAEAAARMKALVDEVIPYLRKLGWDAAESRRRAEGACAFLPDGNLHDRVKSALSGSWQRAAKAEERSTSAAA